MTILKQNILGILPIDIKIGNYKSFVVVVAVDNVWCLSFAFLWMISIVLLFSVL